MSKSNNKYYVMKRIPLPGFALLVTFNDMEEFKIFKDNYLAELNAEVMRRLSNVCKKVEIVINPK